ncbi:MAG: AMP-binding protein [Ruminiclostridium sp.]|nr:AMP-binding protein [Ruminiclostridium sp.]
MAANSIYPIHPITDLKDMLEQSGRLFAEKDAFWIKSDNESYKGIKYREFKKDVDALGTAFLSLGLKGAFIAVIGENRYEWCLTYLAAVNGTGITVPLDKELPPVEVENLLQRSGARAVIFSGKHEKEMRQISASISTVKYYINMDAAEDEQGFMSFNRLLGKGRELLEGGDCSYTDAKINAEEMSILLFTSGTTDLAKGVMLSHKNICWDIMAVSSIIYIDPNDSVLSILPLHHTYECTCGFLLMIYSGCRISFTEGLKHIGKNLKETSPTLLLAVPLILEGMYKKIWEQAAKKKGMTTKLKIALFISGILYDTFKIDVRRKLFHQVHENIGGKMRLVISGAAAIDPKVSKGFRALGVKVLQGYGLTECSPIVTANMENNFRDDSIGMLLPGMEGRIENPNADGVGELVVKGGNVMLGYFGNTLATGKILKDGWLYTGDLCRMDISGFYYMTGRKKNVIVTKNGKNIYPEEVEAYLNKSPYILESLVWGKLDDESEETFVYAQIVPALDMIAEKLGKQDVSQDEAFNAIEPEVKAVNRNKPLYKRIRRFTIREEEFAKTSTKKIKRYVERIE